MTILTTLCQAVLSPYGALRADFMLTRLSLDDETHDAICGIFSGVERRLEQDREDGVPKSSHFSYAMAYLEEELRGCDSYGASKWFADRDPWKRAA